MADASLYLWDYTGSTRTCATKRADGRAFAATDQAADQSACACSATYCDGAALALAFH